jgi:hypothetical protein
MKRREKLIMLYDDRADITSVQLERILQGTVWLADTIFLPSYARASLTLPDEVRREIEYRLSELAEAGYIGRWQLEPSLHQGAVRDWWPSSTTTFQVDENAYDHLDNGIRVGVSLYRQDTLRGAGRKPRSMISGISEFVSLRDSFWTVGLAHTMGAEYLLSSDTRSIALAAPLRRLQAIGQISGPISSTIMKLHEIGSLTALSIEDINKLRRYKPTARALIADIVHDVDADILNSLDPQTYLEAAVDSTRRHYTMLLNDAVKTSAKTALAGNLAGIGVSIAGTIFPPLGSLSFAEPLISLDPRGKSGRRLVSFLAKLRKRVEKRSQEPRKHRA